MDLGLIEMKKTLTQPKRLGCLMRGWGHTPYAFASRIQILMLNPAVGILGRQEALISLVLHVCSPRDSYFYYGSMA